MYLRATKSEDWGDYEQYTSDLYSTFNYLQLYILGANGENRKQLQIYNKYDPCCFSGSKSMTYKGFVRSQVFKLGTGEFDVYIDDTHKEHKISDTATALILKELG